MNEAGPTFVNLKGKIVFTTHMAFAAYLPEWQQLYIPYTNPLPSVSHLILVIPSSSPLSPFQRTLKHQSHISSLYQAFTFLSSELQSPW
jgi:hypothetical protein